MFNFIKNIKEYFRIRREKNSSKLDLNLDESFIYILTKRSNTGSGTYVDFWKQYYDLKDSTTLERETLLQEHVEKMRKVYKNEALKQNSSLRIIKTLRTEKEIRDALNAGHKVLWERVKASKSIFASDLHIKNRKIGTVKITPYSFHDFPSEGDGYRLVKEVNYYPYIFTSKIATYLLPDDLRVGEEVILEDLIEDVVGASHPSGSYRQDSAKAIWNGKKFVIDHSSYNVSITMG